MIVSTEQSTPVDNGTGYLLAELARLRRENAKLQRRATDARHSRDYWKQRAKAPRTSVLAADDPRHGTANGYNNLGCRCGKCRAAWSEYYRDYTHRTGRHRPQAEYVAEVRARAEARDNHGTESRYSNLGCRCPECTRAASESRKRRRREGRVFTHNANGYRNGCRCEVCREAHKVSIREYRSA